MTDYRVWANHEIETIYDLMRTHAPWRGPYPMDDPDFMCAWLNEASLLDSQSNLSKETLEEWWKSTPEYIEQWPIWTAPKPPDPPIIPPNPIDPPNPFWKNIEGQLRIDQAGYCDDVKRINPVGIHLGDLFSVFTYNPDKAESIVLKARKAEYPLIHFWMNLGTVPGDDYWAGRECGPGFNPDFWQKLSRFGDLLDSYGIKGGYNLGDYNLRTGTHREFFRELGRHLKSREHKTAAYVFGGNEAWKTGASNSQEISDALNEFKAECSTVMCTTTSPPSENASDIAAWCDGDFYAIHGYRGGEDHDRIRHIFGVPWEGHPPTSFGYEDEWTGPGSVVSVKPPHCYSGRDVDANHMCAGAVHSLMCNMGFNYFCSAGVKSDTDVSTYAGFYEVAKVSQIVPIDIMAWPKPFHFGSSQSAHRVFSPVSGNSFRFDHRISHDGRIFGQFYGDEGHAVARCERACFLSIVNYSGEVLPEEQFDLGEQITFDFVRSQNGQPGHTSVVVSGRLR